MTFHTLAASATCLAIMTVGAVANETKIPALEAGVLTCELSDTTNLVVVSEAKYNCLFENSVSGMPDEIYEAEIDKVGLDLSTTDTEILSWLVVSLNGEYGEGIITGNYIGASADAAIVAGGGVRGLVGGAGNKISLQPVSLSGSEGFGAAIGLERLKLQYVGPAA